MQKQLEYCELCETYHNHIDAIDWGNMPFVVALAEYIVELKRGTEDHYCETCGAIAVDGACYSHECSTNLMDTPLQDTP